MVKNFASQTQDLVFLKRRSKVKDKGGDGDNAGNGPEGTSETITGCGDKVGVGGGRFENGSIDHHLWCLGGRGASEGYSELTVWGRERDEEDVRY